MKTRVKNTICFLVTGIDFFISKGYPLFPYSKLTKLNDGLSLDHAAHTHRNIASSISIDGSQA
jgi:hypothetical protein